MPRREPQWWARCRWLRRFEKGWTYEALAAYFKVSRTAVLHCLNADRQREMRRERYHRLYKRRQQEGRTRKETLQTLEDAMTEIYGKE